IVAGSEQITPQMLPLINLSQAEIDKIAATVPGGAPNIRDIYPLGPLQEGILFHHLLDPAHDVYVLSSLFAMDSKEAVESLLAKLTFIVARHDVLRTAIVWEGLSQAVQVVCDSVTVPVQWEAIEGDVIAHMQQKQGHSQMDLTRAPLLAVHIGFNAAQSEFVVMVKFHHLISDHVGLEIIAQELAYFERGEQDKLAAPVPYRNFIAHTQARQAEQDSEGYFRAQLGDIDSPTTPFNLLDIQGDGRNIDAQRVKVPAALSAGLRKAAVNLKLSPAVLFHAAWGIVVGRCSQQEDVVFGTVLSGRLQGT
ncbi:non-ribosomal peptide synthetase, partial [Pseudoalteromonas rubra]